MRYYLLLVVVCCASFFAIALFVSAAAAAAWPLLVSRLTRIAPRMRAQLLVAIRTAPSVAGLFAAVIVAAVFIRTEPRDTAETAGLLLATAAASAVALLAIATIRVLDAARSAAEAARLIAHCPRVTHDGTSLSVVRTAYPVAAIAGLFRTRFLVSERVLRECTREELELILAHERAHLTRRDHLVRVMMLGLPDPLALVCTAVEIEREWAIAAEEAADAEAAGANAARAAALAGTLIKVARMATTRSPNWMPALGFYRGENLERRVTALLAMPAEDRRAEKYLKPLLSVSTVAAAAVAIRLTDAVSVAIEWSVRVLP